VTRVLEPLGLVLKSGIWYLVARVDGQDRAYRVSRILHLDLLDEAFARPEGFDLAAFWQAWIDRFVSVLYYGEATVRLSPRGLELLPHYFDGPVVTAVQASASPPGADGWVRAVLPIESLQHAERALLRLGPDVEVLAPPDLRDRMLASAEALVRLYQAPVT
jgi:predicted DNA-binding transcriptional regulator YafY